MSYKFKRRAFLQSIGAAAGLASFLRGLETAEAQVVAPQRLLFIQRPVGTVAQAWFPAGRGPTFEPSRILTQFNALRERMVVFEDLRLPSSGSVGGGHERGTVLMLTGQRTTRLYPGNGGDDPIAEGPSIDQYLATGAPRLQGTAIASLQLAADNRADTPEVSTRNMSYSGPQAPLRPYYQPQAGYQRVFGTLMPGGATPDNLAALERGRAQKRSVLDFALKDLARLQALSPASQRPQLEMHAAAIREVETEFDATPLDPVGCGVATAPPNISVSTRTDPYSGDHIVPQRDDQVHSQVGALHLSVIKAAFRCDLTRVVTYQWSPGTNHVSFGDLWPPNPAQFKVHHTTSHDPGSPDQAEFLTRVEEFYALRAANFLQELAAVPEVTGSGSVLDNTLVPYITEVAERNHSWTRMPFLLFGGLGLIGNRRWDNANGGLRSSNDLWMALAERFGMPGFTLGDNDMHTTAIPGLFA
ncbi:MAG TPA: DUF1552 domain-containing protein [Polyangiaceae bacterium]|nr:DUF1552 domain-containing protein [Polyangiaceae bacterium]